MLKKDFYIDIHPGEVLAGILEDAGLSQSELARAIGSSRKVISEICNRKRGISAEMAFRLGKALKQTPDFWMNAQKNWELSQVDQRITKKVQKIVGREAA